MSSKPDLWTVGGVLERLRLGYEAYPVDTKKAFEEAFGRNHLAVAALTEFRSGEGTKIGNIRFGGIYLTEDNLQHVTRAINAALDWLGEPDPKPLPIILWCPCGTRHIDEGEYATKEHHTHACQSCGLVWRPAIVPTVGVRFLPGYKNEEPPEKP